VFALSTPEVIGSQYTDPQTIVATAGLAGGEHPNVLTLHTEAMRDAIEALPAVAGAGVRVVLPDRLVISVTERSPVFAIDEQGATYLVDVAGAVLAQVDPAAAEQLGLPVIHDERRTLAADVSVGGELDPIDLAAILQLGAVTPETIASSAAALGLSIDDENGFVLAAQPSGWQAIFGMYTPTLRPPDLIPRQVQCLRSLIGDGEQDLARIYLSPMDERCGTFLESQPPRATASPIPSP
jgi:hypothetical protein